MVEILPGSPNRERDSDFPNDPLRPSRLTDRNDIGRRLDEPTRDGAVAGGDDPTEPITIHLDADDVTRAEPSEYRKLRAELSAERQRARALEIAASQQLAQVQKSQIEGTYANVYQQREMKIREAAEKAANYDGEGAERARADIAALTTKLVLLHDGKTALEQQQQQQANPAADRERFLESQDPVNQELIRATNGRFFDDPEYQARAVSASGYLINVKKLKTTDPAYRREMERIMRDDNSYRARESSARAYSAPPSRAAGLSTSGGYRGEVITLTPEEVSIARATLPPSIIGDRDPLIVYAARKRERLASQS